ncbi:M23 family metallopeptidase [Kitasatospora sp. NBC_00240]|uniref:M23 family metallopeptidase n=1 Tax=Kitasatospora sp. NBC_00240 TaxID=2903567 RepID=UPI00225AD68D|nr:M23 family metallopeptidase [Kitasatospora sp. NBC_00240]MCX5210597.1 M23 family metallopeptidase [Kitasatospora sp. NBC_00240]
MAPHLKLVPPVSCCAGSALPPRPDRPRHTVLLALLLAAVFLLTLPGPLAHALPARVPHAEVGPVHAAAPPLPTERAWPVGGPADLLRRFDAPATKWAAGHRGVDLAAVAGSEVRSAAPGVVTFSGVVAGRPVVTVSHPGSGTPPLRTTYLPVAGTLPVGTQVSAGMPVGLLTPGLGHCAEGCLHWGLLRGDRYLDPLALLGTGTARLLPLHS